MAWGCQTDLWVVLALPCETKEKLLAVLCAVWTSEHTNWRVGTACCELRQSELHVAVYRSCRMSDAWISCPNSPGRKKFPHVTKPGGMGLEIPVHTRPTCTNGNGWALLLPSAAQAQPGRAGCSAVAASQAAGQRAVPLRFCEGSASGSPCA